MLCQYCTDIPDIAQEISRANSEQKEKIVRDTSSPLRWTES